MDEIEGMNKEIFDKLDADSKLSVLYVMITGLCQRTAKLEKYKWWSRALVLTGSAVGGGLVIYFKGTF